MLGEAYVPPVSRSPSPLLAGTPSALRGTSLPHRGSGNHSSISFHSEAKSAKAQKGGKCHLQLSGSFSKGVGYSQNLFASRTPFQKWENPPFMIPFNISNYGKVWRASEILKVPPNEVSLKLIILMITAG